MRQDAAASGARAWRTTRWRHGGRRASQMHWRAVARPRTRTCDFCREGAQRRSDTLTHSTHSTRTHTHVRAVAVAVPGAGGKGSVHSTAGRHAGGGRERARRRNNSLSRDRPPDRLPFPVCARQPVEGARARAWRVCTVCRARARTQSLACASAACGPLARTVHVEREGSTERACVDYRKFFRVWRLPVGGGRVWAVVAGERCVREARAEEEVRMAK